MALLRTSVPLYTVRTSRWRQEYDKAGEFYKKAIRCDPKNTTAMYNYANMLKHVFKNFDAAQEVRVVAMLDRVKTCRVGNDVCPTQCYEKVIRINPKHADALGNLANLLADVRDDKVAARRYYERAVKADPRNADNLVRAQARSIVRAMSSTHLLWVVLYRVTMPTF